MANLADRSGKAALRRNPEAVEAEALVHALYTRRLWRAFRCREAQKVCFRCCFAQFDPHRRANAEAVHANTITKHWCFVLLLSHVFLCQKALQLLDLIKQCDVLWPRVDVAVGQLASAERAAHLASLAALIVFDQSLSTCRADGMTALAWQDEGRAAGICAAESVATDVARFYEHGKHLFCGHLWCWCARFRCLCLRALCVFCALIDELDLIVI